MTSLLPTSSKPPLLDPAHRPFMLRKLHSLSGVVPLGGFLVVHLWTNARALSGQASFDEAVATINRLPLLPLFEAGILVPLAFHALYGVKLAFEGRANVGRYALGRNWMYTMQRVSGLAALVFLLYHLWQLWLPKTLGTLAPASFYPLLAAQLSSTWHGLPLVGLGYVLGLAACCFHFANGLWGFCASWGITESPRAQRRAAVVFGLLGLGVFLLGADTALFFATGSRLFGGPPDDRPASARVVREPTAAMHQVRPLEIEKGSSMVTNAPSKFVRHTKKTEWGVGWLRESDSSYARYLFQDGETRAFPAQALTLLTAADPSAEELTVLESLGAKHTKEANKNKKPRKKVISEELRGGPDSTRKLAAAATAISSVAQQIDIFKKLFPKGFADEKFIDQERGGHGSRKIGRQGAVDLARESLAVDPLRKVLLDKGVGSTNLLKKLLAKAKTLFAVEEIDGFNLFAKTPGNEQRLAEALFELVHGQGAPGANIEAVATALPPDLRSWRLVTFPGAFARPTDLLYVDPDVTFRQAHIVGVPVPFLTTVSTATYQPLLEMAHKLSAELNKAGLTPRDLLDVHLFTARTLLSSKKKLARGARVPRQRGVRPAEDRGDGGARGASAR